MAYSSLNHIVRSPQHMQPVVATATHQVNVVLEVPQAVPLWDLPHRLGRHFRVAEDQAVDHLRIGDRPAPDRSQAEAAQGQYQRHQLSRNLHSF